MQLPIKAHYATLAMLALAQQYEAGEPLPARVISGENRIPSQFLGQIMQQLRAAGLINSTRGSSGGFQLTRAPAAISVATIVQAICPGSLSDTPDARSHTNEQAVHAIWERLRVVQNQVLQEITLADLVEQTAGTPDMFYI